MLTWFPRHPSSLVSQHSTEHLTHSYHIQQQDLFEYAWNLLKKYDPLANATQVIEVPLGTTWEDKKFFDNQLTICYQPDRKVYSTHVLLFAQKEIFYLLPVKYVERNWFVQSSISPEYNLDERQVVGHYLNTNKLEKAGLRVSTKAMFEELDLILTRLDREEKSFDETERTVRLDRIQEMARNFTESYGKLNMLDRLVQSRLSLRNKTKKSDDS